MTSTEAAAAEIDMRAPRRTEIQNIDDLNTADLDGDGEMRYVPFSPDDTRHDNTRRAGFAAAALVAYAGQVGGNQPFETLLSDLLNDLRHLADVLGVDYDDADTHYPAEINGEP